MLFWADSTWLNHLPSGMLVDVTRFHQLLRGQTKYQVALFEEVNTHICWNCLYHIQYICVVRLYSIHGILVLPRLSLNEFDGFFKQITEGFGFNSYGSTCNSNMLQVKRGPADDQYD